MKVNFGYITANKENKSISSFNVHPDEMTFDTDWFLYTNPSINNTEYFLPDWEDASDKEWVLLYFVAECAAELLNNNRDGLCGDAIKALENFIFLTTPSEDDIVPDSSELLRDTINKLREDSLK